MRRSGIQIIADTPGDGAPVERQHVYQLRLKMWLNKGDPIRWQRPWGLIDRARLEDDGEAGIPGTVPAGAVIIVEIKFIAERKMRG